MALRVRIYQPSGGGGGGSGIVQSVVAGTGVSVDSTDPANPIVSATGGGSGLITGEVATFADLPTSTVTAPVGSYWIVQTSTGVWLVNRRPRGLYRRIAGSGTLATDYEVSNDYPVDSVNGKVGTVVVDKTDVGLGNVDNTSDATKNAAAVTLTNKTLTSPVINTPTGIVKGDVGLGNVDNTSNATERAATATLTNKTISGASNTVNNLPVASMVMNTARLLGRSTASTGVVEEIVLGTNLSFTGTTLNAAGGGGGGGGTKTVFRFTPLDGQPPATNYATRDTRNSLAIFDFDDTTDEAIRFISVVPEGASLGSGMTVRLKIGATTATSGATRFGARFAKLDQDVDGLTFDTAVEANLTISGTSGIFTWLSLTPITTLDSIAAGDAFVVEIYRAASNGGDTMVGDAELIAIEGQAI